MPIFFQRQADNPALRGVLVEALATDPGTLQGDQAKADRAATLVQQAAATAQQPQLSGSRLVVAVVLLIALIALGFYAAQNPDLKDWSATLNHSFELVFGLILGALGGEAAATR
jgi:hypothetical protein